MTLLNHLPEVLSLAILSNWCKVKNVMCLDSSMSQKNERKHFLVLLRGYPYHLSGTNLQEKYDDKMLTWAIARTIDLKHLSLTKHSIKFINTKGDISDSMLSLKSVVSLSYSAEERFCVNTNELLHIISTCINLTQLYIGRLVDDDYDEDDSDYGVNTSKPTEIFNINDVDRRILNQLTSLSLIRCSVTIPTALLDDLSTTCPMLTHLKIQLTIKDIQQSHLLKVLETHPLLKHIELSLNGLVHTEETFQTITKYCTRIEYVHITGSFEIMLPTIQDFLLSARYSLTTFILNDKKNGCFIQYKVLTNNVKFVQLSAVPCTDIELIAFMTGVPQFGTIILNEISCVTYSVLATINKMHCRTLSLIILTDCDGLTYTKEEVRNVLLDCEKILLKNIVVLCSKESTTATTEGVNTGDEDDEDD